jgi:hypothetical protein
VASTLSSNFGCSTACSTLGCCEVVAEAVVVRFPSTELSKEVEPMGGGGGGAAKAREVEAVDDEAIADLAVIDVSCCDE